MSFQNGKSTHQDKNTYTSRLPHYEAATFRNQRHFCFQKSSKTSQPDTPLRCLFQDTRNSPEPKWGC